MKVEGFEIVACIHVPPGRYTVDPQNKTIRVNPGSMEEFIRQIQKVGEMLEEMAFPA
jgi:hypothetical protein